MIRLQGKGKTLIVECECERVNRKDARTPRLRKDSPHKRITKSKSHTNRLILFYTFFNGLRRLVEQTGIDGFKQYDPSYTK